MLILKNKQFKKHKKSDKWYVSDENTQIMPQQLLTKLMLKKAHNATNVKEMQQ